jgi:hypothetical protein
MRRVSAALAAIYAIEFSQLASAADLPRKAPVASSAPSDDSASSDY